MKTKKTFGDYSFTVINGAIFFLFAFLCIYPFIYIFFYSLSDSLEVIKHPVFFKPSGFTLQHYIDVFKLKGLGLAFLISGARSIVGTVLTVLLSSMFAYILTKKELPFRRFIYRALVVTMYLSFGLIPWYITMITLGLRDNFLLYVLPTAIAPFSIILIKTYMESLPPALEESAYLDGANTFIVFIKIVMPLCMPVLAAIALFSAVNQWNSWADNFYLVSNPKLKTAQLILREYLTQAESLASSMRTGKTPLNPTQLAQITPTSIRMTTTIIVTLPIMCIYPFLQKYFVKGIMIGAIKG